MSENLVTSPSGPHQAGFGRRYFLSLSVLVGSVVALNESAAFGGAEPAAAAAAFLRFAESLSVADSLALYTNLLPDIRKVAFYQSLREIGLLKELASGRLDQLIDSAHSLNSKYRNAQAASKENILADFRQLIDQVEGTWQIRDALDRSRNELPRLAGVDSKIDSVHAHLLQASEYFDNADNEPKPTATKSIADGRAELNKAINVLKGFLRGEIDETNLNSPIERLIVLLLGVDFAVDKPKPSIAVGNGNSHRKLDRSHHATSAPASSIMQVLRRHITPGSWLQLGIGYGVTFPVLLRNSSPGIREKLLMDGLRLVPGLVPSPLISVAKELAALSI